MINEVNLVLNNNTIEKNENIDKIFLKNKKESNIILNDALSKKQRFCDETISHTNKLKSKKAVKQLSSQGRMTTFASLESNSSCRSRVSFNILYNKFIFSY